MILNWASIYRGLLLHYGESKKCCLNIRRNRVFNILSINIFKIKTISTLDFVSIGQIRDGKYANILPEQSNFFLKLIGLCIISYAKIGRTIEYFKFFLNHNFVKLILFILDHEFQSNSSVPQVPGSNPTSGNFFLDPVAASVFIVFFGIAMS